MLRLLLEDRGPEVGAQALEPGKLVGAILGIDGLAVRHVDIHEPHGADGRRDDAPLRIIVPRDAHRNVVGVPHARGLRRLVVGLLPVGKAGAPRRNSASISARARWACGPHRSCPEPGTGRDALFHLERQLAARADGAPRPLARRQRGGRHRAPGTEARRRAFPARGNRGARPARRLLRAEDLQRRRNPLARGAQDIAMGIPGDNDPQRRVIAATIGPCGS